MRGFIPWFEYGEEKLSEEEIKQAVREVTNQLGSSPGELFSELFNASEEFGVHCCGCGRPIKPNRSQIVIGSFLNIAFACNRCKRKDV